MTGEEEKMLYGSLFLGALIRPDAVRQAIHLSKN